MATMASYVLIPDKEDFLERELEDLRLRMEHPEIWEEKERQKKEASEIARQRLEAASNLPEDYFDGWDLYEVKRGDSLWHIASKYLGSGLKSGEIINNNDQQLPFGANSIKVGMKLRIAKVN